MDRSDEEQLQRLNDWWRRNGPSLMLGAALALVVLAGWWGFGAWQERSAQMAAAAYSEFLQAERQQAEISELEQLGQRLLDDHGSSGYAVLTAMRLARHQMDTGAYQSAADTLGWLVENARERPTAELARLRQARALAQEDPEQAVGLLGSDVSRSFKAAYAELRGDLLVDLGRSAEAAEAYREALAVNGLAPQSRELVEIKLRAVESGA
ncbi:YfgM family protein [Halorhodospira abdelmalekii]|uniref:YfgM family protein n=1 Tax=Halorhodospira abdelmalekii TaxID=421629 RepID=UPI001908E37E|nr:tetratricopeptide repeat protein [Halorhodospira abdelmalekii]